MAMKSRMALLLALAAGAAIGAALTMRRRDERRHVEKRHHKRDLQAWEGEGGSLSEPAVAAHGS